MSKHPFELIGVLALAAIVVPGLLHAGTVQVGGQGGTGSPPGDLCEQQGEDCTIETDLQPDQLCDYVDEPPSLVDVDEYADVDTLVTCMLNAKDRITGSFDSGPLPGGTGGPWGVEYFRTITLPGFPPLTFEVEIDRLEYNEDDPAIRTTQLIVDQGNLVARIAEITEGPDTVGSISVVLVDHEEAVVVNDVDGDVVDDDSFFVITHPDGFKRVQFNSTNNGVVKSGIALLPEDDPEIEHLSLPE